MESLVLINLPVNYDVNPITRTGRYVSYINCLLLYPSSLAVWGWGGGGGVSELQHNTVTVVHSGRLGGSHGHLYNVHVIYICIAII